jgi:hypothetical protein
MRRTDSKWHGSQIRTPFTRAGHYQIDIVGLNLIDEAEALHGEMKPFVRDNIECGKRV